VRIVLDTNVLLAAFASHGLCEAVVTVCLSDHDIVLSEPILVELSRHLVRKVKLPPRQAEENVRLVREHSELVEPAVVESGACRDPKDLMVLGTAVAGRADAIVTGDQDLLVLKAFQGVEIWSPRTFYDQLD